MTKNNDKVRGFEFVSGYEDAGLDLPVRATQYSAGYDFQSAETIVVPSIWRQVGQFLDDISDNGKVDYDLVSGYINKSLEEKELKDIIKESNLRPTLIDTGVKSYMQDDEYLQLSNRSSGAMNRGLLMSNGIAIIDKDYHNNKSNEGKIYFQFINILPFDVTVEKGERIGQGIFKKYLVSDDDNASGVRVGGHGSSD